MLTLRSRVCTNMLEAFLNIVDSKKPHLTMWLFYFHMNQTCFQYKRIGKMCVFIPSPKDYLVMI